MNQEEQYVNVDLEFRGKCRKIKVDGYGYKRFYIYKIFNEEDKYKIIKYNLYRDRSKYDKSQLL